MVGLHLDANARVDLPHGVGGVADDEVGIDSVREPVLDPARILSDGAARHRDVLRVTGHELVVREGVVGPHLADIRSVHVKRNQTVVADGVAVEAVGPERHVFEARGPAIGAVVVAVLLIDAAVLDEHDTIVVAVGEHAVEDADFGSAADAHRVTSGVLHVHVLHGHRVLVRALDVEGAHIRIAARVVDLKVCEGALTRAGANLEAVVRAA